MKKVTIPACFAAIMAIGTACNSNAGSDTAAAASDSVQSTMESGATAATGAMTDSASAMSSNTSSADTSMGADQTFVLEAASGGLMEVELGKIAATNAASAKVKDFGRMMVTDHTKANTELKAVAGKKSITVPPAPAEKHQQHIDELKTKKGAEFDKAYVDMMVNDHKEDISKFEDEAKNGKDPDVKAFASKTLPVLNKHLKQVQTLQDGMKQ